MAIPGLPMIWVSTLYRPRLPPECKPESRATVATGHWTPTPTSTGRTPLAARNTEASDPPRVGRPSGRRPNRQDADASERTTASTAR